MNSVERVLYLCFTQKGEEGFVFPSELEKDEYNPGIYVISGMFYYKLADKYIFEAIDGEKKIETTLEKYNRNIYVVRTKKYGVFFFRAKMIAKKYNHYIGKYSTAIVNPTLYELVPFQSTRLEEVCKASNFYFLGSLENVDKKNI